MLLLKPNQPDQDPALTNQIRKESHVTFFGHLNTSVFCMGLGPGNFDLYGNSHSH